MRDLKSGDRVRVYLHMLTHDFEGYVSRVADRRYGNYDIIIVTGLKLTNVPIRFLERIR